MKEYFERINFDKFETYFDQKLFDDTKAKIEEVLSNVKIEQIDKKLNKQKIGEDPLMSLINTKEEISKVFASEIIAYYFNYRNNRKNVFDLICDKYSYSPEFLKKIKEYVNNLGNKVDRSVFKSKLLQKDLLSGEELKAFYEEIRSEPDLQSQVLLSAEVLGSLSYTGDKEKIDKIFGPEEVETKKNLEFISSFVKKYPLQNKGRTIAVMLFSKEYLPDRSIGEIVEKVAGRLSKYERVLEQYQYKGIPAGLKASVGLEYEITHSTANGYKELTNRDLKTDIVRLSEAAHIGNGADAVHEIATRPTDEPYLLFLEMQLLNDLEYIDLNFERSPEYQKGARGYHLTIGGETGLSVNANTNFLQNSILSAGWGGIYAGEVGKRVSGGRGVTLRGRSPNDGHNVKVFDNPTYSVELRSLSIDKIEPLQRAISTAYNGAIAIQALEKYTDCSSDTINDFYESNSVKSSEKEFMEKLKESSKLKDGYDSDPKNIKIIYAWAELVAETKEALEYHNNEFLTGETLGYLKKDGVWVDSEDFGGNYNRKRFDSVVSSIDSTLSVEEYVNSTKIDFNKLFSSFDVDLADSLTKVNNLYLKPGSRESGDEKNKKVKLSGDQANTISMLEVTKFNNENLEHRDEAAYLKGTVFDTLGERREGYYYVQGGSEKMITHACQIALLNFNKKMEEILKN